MLDFFKNKSIFITGHTGFKGAWLCRILQHAGASITGYALEPESGAVYSDIIKSDTIKSVINDIRDFSTLKSAFDIAAPEIVFHLAAQPLVLDAYDQPVYTFETNVQGTVNLLECVRLSESVKSVVVVTTDKVYKNDGKPQGYIEDDILGGNEPYSASKACAEFVTSAYLETFLRSRGVAVSTARAGNVIGGGDISKNRIIPDCIRSARYGESINIRNPKSVRPYQHVLEPLFAYLLISEKQYGNVSLSDNYNIGPNEADCITTAEIADVFCSLWGDNQSWQHISNTDAPYESALLKLDCSKIRSAFGWNPVWDVHTAVSKTVAWEKATYKQVETDNQIVEYIEEYNK